MHCPLHFSVQSFSIHLHFLTFSLFSCTFSACLLRIFKHRPVAMGGACIEEGLPITTTTTPLLLNSKLSYSSDHEAGSSFNSNAESTDSSITPVLVLSTFVAVCGSFCYGCAVSSHALIPLFFLIKILKPIKVYFSTSL